MPLTESIIGGEFYLDLPRRNRFHANVFQALSIYVLVFVFTPRGLKSGLF